MRSNFRRVVALLVMALMILGRMPTPAYGEPANRQDYGKDPFEFMTDSSPQLMTVEDIIKFVFQEEISRGEIDIISKILQDFDYGDIEDGKLEIRTALEDANGRGDVTEIYLKRLNDILEQQKEFLEQSMTDRFIVKYKKNGEVAFKEQIEDIINKSSDLKTFSAGSSVKRDLIILKEQVNPAEFAEQLKDSGIGAQIEYIQPDFQMELGSLGANEGIKLRLEVTEEGEPEEIAPGGGGQQETNEDFGKNEESAKPDEKQSGENEKPTDETGDEEETLLEELLVEEIGGEEVIVALIDTGLDITHPNLQDYIYINQNEIPGNGIDDDGNGMVDDLHGWNFPENSGTVWDGANGLEQAHATHLAGIIAGLSDAGDGLTPNSNIKILPLQVFSGGIAYTSDIIAAIEYAENMGAKIVNCSFGSTNGNPALMEAIESSEMLFVCSVGNARADLDITPVYPACFDLGNVISITSVNADGGLSYFSNYSPSLVDLGALGRDIESTLPNGEYGLQSGTSMSAAVVSGTAAAVLSAESDLDAATLKERLLVTSDKLSNLQETITDGRRINAQDAMMSIEKTDIQHNTPEDDFDVKGYSPMQAELYQLYSSSKVIQVAAGGEFSLALKEDGTVWAWGRNDYGQCGNGITYISEKLTQVVGLTDVIHIAAGNSHSLAVKSDGTVWAWGRNSSGNLGDGTTTIKTIPVQVSGLSGVIQVAAGESHNLAVKLDGMVWTWGNNSSGQLGDGTTANKTIPVQVNGLTQVVQAAAGDYHSLVVKLDGTIWTWGNNSFGQLGDGTKTQRTTPVQVSGLSGIAQAAAGYSHSLVVKLNGTVWAWGSNFYGELGDGTTTQRTTPVQVNDISEVAQVSAGFGHSLTTKSDGTAWTWGNNSYGQLGDGTIVSKTTPVQVSDLTGPIQVSAGPSHNLTIKSDGTVWAWGCNSYGRLGDGSTWHVSIPQKVTGLNYITMVVAGDNYNLALKQDGTVWAWGENSYGQLGNGTFTDKYVPVQVNGLTDIIKISAGKSHSLAIKSDGTVWAWGDNTCRQLGDGTTATSAIPVQVKGINDAIRVAAGDYHSLALKADGTVWGWGDNCYGQLGESLEAEPHQIYGISGIIDIDAAEDVSYAVKLDSTVWRWGYKTHLCYFQDSCYPEIVSVGSDNISSISVGNAYNGFAVKQDGTVWSWYHYYLGKKASIVQLNEGYSQIAELTNVNHTSAGYSDGLAVKSDGTVWKLGGLYYHTPSAQAMELDNIENVGSGYSHSIGVKADGTVWAWGLNDYGQLGVKNTINSATPRQCHIYSPNYGVLHFEKSNYTSVIPASGASAITLSAAGIDTDGDPISASDICYELNGTYSGVSINASTGVVTIDSTAQPGEVQITASYQDLTCSTTLTLIAPASNSLRISAITNKTYYVNLNADSISGFAGKSFTLLYDPTILEPVDLSSFTWIKETAPGEISGTGIIVTESSAGRIVLTVNRTISTGKAWSGTINIFEFKAKSTGQTDLTASSS